MVCRNIYQKKMIKSTTGTSNSIMLPAFPSGQHANYSDEICRLITYREMDKEGFFHAVSMAKSGLYYTGRGDSVRCYSCLTKISNWNAQNINPDLLHCGLAPECRHLAHQDETNQPIVYPDDVTTDKICRYLQLQYEKLSHNPTQVCTLFFFPLMATMEHIGLVVRMSVLDTEVDTPAAVCCFLEQDTLSALLQSTLL